MHKVRTLTQYGSLKLIYVPLTTVVMADGSSNTVKVLHGKSKMEGQGLFNIPETGVYMVSDAANLVNHPNGPILHYTSSRTSSYPDRQSAERVFKARKKKEALKYKAP